MPYISNPAFLVVVQTYSGSGDDSVNSCYMNFQLRGSPEHAPAMCEAIGRIAMVQNWALSCSAALAGQGKS